MIFAVVNNNRHLFVKEQKERINLLKRINELEDNICNKCPLKSHRICLDKCEVGKELAYLGRQIMSITKRRSKEIIRRHLEENTIPSIEEIRYLNDRGYSIYNLAGFFGWDEAKVRRVQIALREYRKATGSPRIL